MSDYPSPHRSGSNHPHPKTVTDQGDETTLAPNDQRLSTASSNASTTSELTPETGSLSFGMIAKLKVKAHRWARPEMEDFGRMSYADFRKSVRQKPELLYPNSMRHESWAGSDKAEPPTIKMWMLLLCTIAVGVGMGVGVAYAYFDYQWGLAAGFAFFGLMAAVFMTVLIAYMMAYSGGLNDNKMGWCVAQLGYVVNIQANVVCRYIMTCCFNKCHCNILDCIFGGEAADQGKRIKALEDGQGPPPGGVCWIGDSEFTFWHKLRADMAPWNPNCFNAGFGGSRLRDITRALNFLCLDWDPSIVIVHAGGNDFDFNHELPAEAMPERLLKLFELIAAHPSVKRIGYMLSSRRPVYSDTKWEFMIRVHTLTIEAIKQHPVGKKVRVIDLRTMVHPLEDFVCDRQHLNEQGHRKKAQVLIQKLTAMWPPIICQVEQAPSHDKLPPAEDDVDHHDDLDDEHPMVLDTEPSGDEQALNVADRKSVV